MDFVVGAYICIDCETTFTSASRTPTCPFCRSTNAKLEENIKHEDIDLSVEDDEDFSYEVDEDFDEEDFDDED